jgi:transposase
MKDVELYARVRYAVQVEGLSERAAARRFGIDPRTVAKMLRFSVPPGYRRTQPPVKPKLGAFIAIIDGILTEDKGRPPKQQHTAKRIFERLRDEHGYTGGLTIVKDYVAGWRQRAREMFVPLAHPPGHAQADFGEAIGIIGGVERKVHFFAFDLPYSDACFVAAYPAESKEAFCDGHVKAFGLPPPKICSGAGPDTRAPLSASRANWRQPKRVLPREWTSLYWSSPASFMRRCRTG